MDEYINVFCPAIGMGSDRVTVDVRSIGMGSDRVFGGISRARWNVFMSVFGEKYAAPRFGIFPPLDIYDIRHVFLDIIILRKSQRTIFVPSMAMISPSNFCEFIAELLLGIDKEEIYIGDVIFGILRVSPSLFENASFNVLLRDCSDEIMKYWMDHNEYTLEYNFLECVANGKIDCFIKKYASKKLPEIMRKIRKMTRIYLKAGYEKVNFGDIHDAMNYLEKRAFS